MNILKFGLFFSLICISCGVNAAVGLDRTRLIYNEQSKSVSVNIQNQNKELPFLAQSWLENAAHEKADIPFAVLPPLQRLEPNSSSLVRFEKTAAVSLLPQDRESVFYFNLREIPPKSDKPNVMQIALQTQIKMFYRPLGVIPAEGDVWQEQLTFSKTDSGYKVNNPTALHITVTGLSKNMKEDSVSGFEGFMAPPKKELDIKLKENNLSHFFITYVDDFGGHPELKFICQKGGLCVAEKKSSIK
ncbi:fimbrial biogenesis chaperone [Iodobacter fluviatilis]|uniref:Chaperone protein papD n=1 Tax=Iodobacter fluviatilis TaxID=537 RepID=A0A377Q6Y6_9NEIS|nr:molecular chaperone [Iodobacter fluviatilis]TCU89313.1 P pilus assembly chaperone PapD [Iodobacter fluviatilis]STQ90683.1 Chaperone protein papD precursor [Iodobacter fluviatilis]